MQRFRRPSPLDSTCPTPSPRSARCTTASSTGCSTGRSTTGSRAIQLVATPLRYAYALLRDLFGGDLGLRAMGLVYSSLFALVPVVAVSFSVLKAFGYHRELEPVLFEFLRPLGEKGIELTVKIMEFVENAQTTVLGTVGFVILRLHRDRDDREDRGRAQLHLARRAAAQPRPARDRIHGHHARRAGPDGCRDGAAHAHRGQRHGGAGLGAGPARRVCAATTRRTC